MDGLIDPHTNTPSSYRVYLNSTVHDPYGGYTWYLANEESCPFIATCCLCDLYVWISDQLLNMDPYACLSCGCPSVEVSKCI